MAGFESAWLQRCAAATIFGHEQNQRRFAMFERLKSALRSLHVPSVAEREQAYLAASVSLIDLERRQREVERGLFRNAFYG
jgi:hypothetical protein